MTTGDMERPGDAERPGAVDDAIWTELVAAFHASPAQDAGPWPQVENLPPGTPGDQGTQTDPASQPPVADAGVSTPSRVVRAARPEQPPADPLPSVTWTGPPGPRDWEGAAEHGQDDGYHPPAPPPLPELSMATKAAWTAGLGGPGYLVLSTLLHWETPQWAALLCVVAGIVGFGYLGTRLKDHPDDDDDDRAVL
jgi:hypothetical protein